MTYTRPAYNQRGLSPNPADLARQLQTEFGNVQRAMASVPFTPYNIIGDFGALPGHDITTVLSSALKQISSGLVFVPRGSYTISGGGITVPDKIGFWFDDGAEFVTQSGMTGPGITFSGQNQVYSRGINVRRASIEWHDLATDTTSIGVRILDCVGCRYEIIKCFNHCRNVQLQSVNAAVGCVVNTIDIGFWDSAFINLDFAIAAGGFTNQNKFSGGSIHNEGTDKVGGLPVVGSKGINLTTAGDGNLFDGIDLEGNAVEWNVDIALTVAANTFNGCRFENISGVRCQAGTSSNTFIGGYGTPATWDGTVWVDTSGGNILMAAGGITANQFLTHAGTNGIVGTYDNFPLLFYQHNAEKGRIDSNGNLLWGSASLVGANPSVNIRTGSLNGVNVALNRQQINTGTSAGVSDTWTLADSTSVLVDAARIDVQKTAAWTNGTAASFMARMNLRVIDTNVMTTYLTIDANAALITLIKAVSCSLTLAVTGQTTLTGLLQANGGAVVTGGGTQVDNVTFAGNKSLISSAGTDGLIFLSNYAQTSFSRLILGGTTTSFPAIKRNAAAINFRLADDSADCNITAAGATLSGVLKLGNAYVATPQITTGYVTLQDSTGTTYKVCVA